MEFKVRSNIKEMLRLIDTMKAEYKRQAARLPVTLATDYRNELFSAVMTGRFSGGYTAYSLPYEKHKMAKKGHLKYWLYRGDFVRALSVFKPLTGVGWGGGIPPGARNSEGKLIRAYAGVNEELRPLFASAFVTLMQTRVPERIGTAEIELTEKWKL